MVIREAKTELSVLVCVLAQRLGSSEAHRATSCQVPSTSSHLETLTWLQATFARAAIGVPTKTTDARQSLHFGSAHTSGCWHGYLYDMTQI